MKAFLFLLVNIFGSIGASVIEQDKVDLVLGFVKAAFPSALTDVKVKAANLTGLTSEEVIESIKAFAYVHLKLSDIEEFDGYELDLISDTLAVVLSIYPKAFNSQTAEYFKTAKVSLNNRVPVMGFTLCGHLPDASLEDDLQLPDLNERNLANFFGDSFIHEWVPEGHSRELEGGQILSSVTFIIKAINLVADEKIMKGDFSHLLHRLKGFASFIALVEKNRFFMSKCTKAVLFALKSIAIDDYFLLPFGYSKHAIIAQFVRLTRTEYLLRIFNTGEGSENHRYMGKDERLPFFEVEFEYNEERLTQVIDTSVMLWTDKSGKFSRPSADDIYSGLLYLLKPKVPKAPTEFPLGFKSQYSGTCTMKSVHALLFFVMNPIEYKALMVETKFKVLQLIASSKDALENKTLREIIHRSCRRLARGFLFQSGISDRSSATFDSKSLQETKIRFLVDVYKKTKPDAFDAKRQLELTNPSLMDIGCSFIEKTKIAQAKMKAERRLDIIPSSDPAFFKNLHDFMLPLDAHNASIQLVQMVSGYIINALVLDNFYIDVKAKLEQMDQIIEISRHLTMMLQSRKYYVHDAILALIKLQTAAWYLCQLYEREEKVEYRFCKYTLSTKPLKTLNYVLLTSPIVPTFKKAKEEILDFIKRKGQAYEAAKMRGHGILGFWPRAVDHLHFYIDGAIMNEKLLKDCFEPLSSKFPQCKRAQDFYKKIDNMQSDLAAYQMASCLCFMDDFNPAYKKLVDLGIILVGSFDGGYSVQEYGLQCSEDRNAGRHISITKSADWKSVIRTAKTSVYGDISFYDMNIRISENTMIHSPFIASSFFQIKNSRGPSSDFPLPFLFISKKLSFFVALTCLNERYISLFDALHRTAIMIALVSSGDVDQIVKFHPRTRDALHKVLDKELKHKLEDVIIYPDTEEYVLEFSFILHLKALFGQSQNSLFDEKAASSMLRNAKLTECAKAHVLSALQFYFAETDWLMATVYGARKSWAMTECSQEQDPFILALGLRFSMNSVLALQKADFKAEDLLHRINSKWILTNVKNEFPLIRFNMDNQHITFDLTSLEFTTLGNIASPCKTVARKSNINNLLNFEYLEQAAIKNGAALVCGYDDGKPIVISKDWTLTKVSSEWIFSKDGDSAVLESYENYPLIHLKDGETRQNMRVLRWSKKIQFFNFNRPFEILAEVGADDEWTLYEHLDEKWSIHQISNGFEFESFESKNVIVFKNESKTLFRFPYYSIDILEEKQSMTALNHLVASQRLSNVPANHKFLVLSDLNEQVKTVVPIRRYSRKNDQN